MDDYQAPIDDIVDALRTVGISDVLTLDNYEGLDLDALGEVLGGFGKLAAEVIAPTDRIGDLQGATLDRESGTVTVPDELGAAFQAYVDGGWQGVSAPPEQGGGGMPGAVGTAVHEMLCSANFALSLNPMLTRGATELLQRWANDAQRQYVLPKLVEGTWTGAMSLTEPDAGSDLSTVRAMAEPTDDGRWRINGTKIFITWGEHELTENIIHLVLARTPGAPEGTRGISLFLVPKFHIDAEGNSGDRNGVICRGLEHKLGIHASPTCELEFVDAIGELVGELHGGLDAMFSMMNPARLAVGVQGVAVAERAYQQAYGFAQERRQGAVPGVEGRAPIIEHPDVQRMVLDLATSRDAIRMLAYSTAVAGDLAEHHPDEERRAFFQRRADLLTPLAKAWPTDEGVRLASLAIQVFGGVGYVEETGIAQLLRDARIAPIYEGTNGIQAIDLVGRKIVRDQRVAVDALFEEIETTIADASGIAELKDAAAVLGETLSRARTATDWIVEHFKNDRSAVLAGATSYLELLSVVVGGHFLLRQAAMHTTDGAPSASRSVRRAQFFAAHHLQQAPTFAAITFGTQPLVDGLA